MPTTSIIQRLSDGTADGAVELTKTVTEEGKVELRATIAAGAVHTNFAGYALAYAKLALLWISAKGSDGAVTFKTNSSGSPGHTFTAPAGGGVAVAWGGTGTNPLGTTDVTGWYISNPGATAADIVIHGLLNAP